MSGSTRSVPEGSHDGLWRRFVVGFGYVIAVVLANSVLTYAGLYKYVEVYEADRLVRSVAAADTESPDIVLVTVDDDDYMNLFGRTSPLNSKAIELIKAIAGFRPKVLGVDLISEGWKTPPSGDVLRLTRIVWAAVPGRSAEQSELQLVERLPFGRGRPEAICMGVPVFWPDADGAIRRQALGIMTDYREMPSFALAVNRSRDDRDGPEWHAHGCVTSASAEKGHGQDERLPIRFSGTNHRFRRLRASSVLAAERDDKGQQADVVSAMADELRGKIVILGGTFAEARDQDRTPIGPMDGVELVAHAVQSLRDGVGEASLLTVARVELVIGVIGLSLLLAASRVKPRLDNLVVAGLLPFVLAVPVGYFVFNYFGTYLSVVGSLLGIPAHHLWDTHRERTHHVKALEAKAAAANQPHVMRQRERTARTKTVSGAIDRLVTLDDSKGE